MKNDTMSSIVCRKDESEDLNTETQTQTRNSLSQFRTMSSKMLL